jgi:hypothetical protein
MKLRRERAVTGVPTGPGGLRRLLWFCKHHNGFGCEIVDGAPSPAARKSEVLSASTALDRFHNSIIIELWNHG